MVARGAAWHLQIGDGHHHNMCVGVVLCSSYKYRKLHGGGELGSGSQNPYRFPDFESDWSGNRHGEKARQVRPKQ